MRVLDVAQMAAVDARMREQTGDVALMRAAGAAIAKAIRELAPDARKVVAFAGPGNNGGDAFAAFAELRTSHERVIYAMPAATKSEGRRDAEARARDAGVHVIDALPASRTEATDAVAGAGLVLDALLGIGARPAPSEAMHTAIAAMNEAVACVLAVDVPTGIDATTGAIDAHAVRADATVTIGAVKIGLMLDPARDLVGKLWLAPIGMAEERERADGPAVCMLTDVELLDLLPKRGGESDKRQSGAPLVFAGSAAYPGAGVLCARGAARAGAGYVTVATSHAAAETMRIHLIEQVVVEYDPADVGSAIHNVRELLKNSSALGIGPGLERDEATRAIVRGVIETLELPFVADAGAFVHLAHHLDLLRAKRCVLTPHEREFATLSGDGEVAPGTRVSRLRAFVARTGITTLLKGLSTLIDDGTTLHINPTGTSALGTAGTGDVLTGMTATLLSQGLSPVDAARAAAYWHGLAGQEAAKRRRVGVIAGDLPEILADALPQAASSSDLEQLLRVFP